MIVSRNGLAAVLQPAMGAKWNALHADIRARFTFTPGATQQSFTGVMQVIERSLAGWVIAKLIAFIHVLPATRARDVPFTFNLRPATNGGWVKERLYEFAGGVFAFRSVMRFQPRDGLTEQFPWGLGMKIKLSVDGVHGDTLYFRDDGYFIRIRGWRMPLPRCCTVGRFTLAHRNIDRDNFEVEISLDHPLLSRLFYQRGVFKETNAAACPEGFSLPNGTAVNARQPAPA